MNRPAHTVSEGLLDTGFNVYAAPKLIRPIYVFALIGFAVWALITLFSGLSAGGVAAFIALLSAPLIFFLGAAYARVLLEVVAVLFQISDSVQRLAEPPTTVGYYDQATLDIHRQHTPTPDVAGAVLQRLRDFGPATAEELAAGLRVSVAMTRAALRGLGANVAADDSGKWSATA